MYLKMITIKESADSDKEWIFPCWNWLDTHLGICETVCEIITIGRSFCNKTEVNESSTCLHQGLYNCYNFFIWL
ncbi:beta-galactosidase-1-like protein [Platysternon megacephalum]|uniref:Beta-galactosidase-1-like protein n=1 Tax=Platysternon megacephalum TaxID=55544 RepID=A0A4D9DKD8_9SAUR|nr:beta-galactosidase-1-like protein [Platysternon megacephalum]